MMKRKLYSHSGAFAAVIAAALMGSAAICAAEPARPISVRNWLIAGPFNFKEANALEDGLDVDYLADPVLLPAGEAEAAPSNDGKAGKTGKAQWKSAGGDIIAEGSGVDFLSAFGGGADSVAYAYAEFSSARAGDTLLKIGSDDGVKVWLNGELVFGHHTRRAFLEAQDLVLVQVKGGVNRLLVKVDQGTGSWEFNVRFADPAAEKAAARGSRPFGLELLLDDSATKPGQALGGVVTGTPAVFAGGGATVELLDGSGKKIASGTAPVFGRFSLKAPPGASGVLWLRATGTAEAAGVRSPLTPVLLGDPAALIKSAVSLARKQAAGPAGKAPGAARSCPDPAATLELLALEIEGRLPRTLWSRDAVVTALGDIANIAGGQAPLPGLHRYAYRSAIDGSLQPYSLYLPDGYDPSKRYGLVVALHGATANDYDMAKSIASAKPDDMLIVAPYGRGDMGWCFSGERDAIDVLDLVQGGYSIDPDRVYLTGRSMGGFGTWRLGQIRASRFAAIATFAGWSAVDCIENLVGTPVLAVHGENDSTIPISADSYAADWLKERGGNVRFEALAGVGHDALGAWTAKLGPNRLLDWFRKQKRQQWPDVVKARTSQARYGQQSWVRILELKRPISPAAVDAALIDASHLSVKTSNVTAFALDLRHPKLAKSGKINVLIDGAALSADALSARAAFEAGADGIFKPVQSPEPDSPPNGGAGFSGLFDGPICFVYGTKATSRTAINKEAAIALSTLNQEGTPPAGADLKAYGIIPDTAVDKALMASHSLVLVGGLGENSVYAKLSGKLPLKLKRDSLGIEGKEFKKSGLIMVYPNPEAPGRFIGVFSLPFGKAAVVGYAQALMAGIQGTSLDSGACGFATPDVMVVGSSLKVEWAGCFDRSWKNLKELEM
jgi:poly(3-hydroxybutyrate) depolymerase